MVATAFIATHRSGGEAFAQGTGTERRIIAAGISSANGYLVAHRLWSDNSIDLRNLGYPTSGIFPRFFATFDEAIWFTVDNGTSGFRPLTDVDMSGETDAGDISQVLLDFNTRSEDLPPPPIDCNITAPR